MAAQHSRLQRWLMRHRIACFVLLTLSFVVFGALSLDLARLLTADSQLLWEHGWMAVMDGALQQLAELSLKAMAACAAWLLFKLCEWVLVQALSVSAPP